MFQGLILSLLVLTFYFAFKNININLIYQ